MSVIVHSLHTPRPASLPAVARLGRRFRSPVAAAGLVDHCGRLEEVRHCRLVVHHLGPTAANRGRIHGSGWDRGVASLCASSGARS